MKKLIILGIVFLIIPIVFAIVKDFTIITCKQAGCEGDGICEPDGYCHYLDGTKERRSCVEVPELCKSEEDRLCFTGMDYPVCIFLKEREVTIRDKEQSYMGISSISFKNNKKFGDKMVTSEEPVFVCDPYEYELMGGNCNTVAYSCRETQICVEKDNNFYCRDNDASNWNSPNPSTDCWRTRVNLQENVYPYKNIDHWTLNTGDEIDITECFNLKLDISAFYDGERGKITSYNNNFILKVNFDCITIDHTDDMTYAIEFDSDVKMCFNINNILSKFDYDEAGFHINLYRDMIGREEQYDVDNELLLDENEYCLDVDTSMYGEIKYTIYTFFNFDNNKFLDDERLIFRYKVVDEIIDDGNGDGCIEYTCNYTVPDCMLDKECNDYKVYNIDRCVNNECIYETSYLFVVIVSVVIVVIIGFLIYTIKKGGK